MWAIIEIAKKQYIVSEGQTIAVERLKGEGPFEFTDVLVYGSNGTVKIGKPYLKDVKVKAELVEEKKADKVLVYKVKRRKKYRKIQGHRQIHTYLKVSKITSKK